MMTAAGTPIKPSIKLIYAAVALALLVALPLALWRLADQPQAIRLEGDEWLPNTGRFAGVRACRECHASIVAEQLASRHANTVRDIRREPPLAPVGDGQRVQDPLTGASYSMEKSAAGPEIVVRQGSLSASQRLDYEFGSGALATGYIARIDGPSWIDARLNYYASIHAWDFTSSQDKPRAFLRAQPLGKPQPETDAARCFWCHGTVVRADGTESLPADTSKLRLRPERSDLNVTCEACHGPREEHVKAWRARRATPAGRHLSADEINQVCGRCHGLSNISQDHPVIARFQPWGLDQSRCFRESAGRLSCLTCHDPHRNAEPDLKFYEARCLACHSRGSREAKHICPVNPRTGCIPCHMRQDSTSMLHVTLTDHRIRVLPQ